ncbi:hypothetical protein [Methylocaldum gracile]|jgi:hypothetical protein|uniref:hypothetical protein n=1 Tax=Methylocaldum sp. 0917 TaxID=2485163 RepID=UPI00105D4383
MTQVLNAIDAGAGAGTVKVYSGTVPANVGTAITDQTLLATLTLSDPGGSVSNGVLTFSAITEDSSGDANGTPTFARLADSNGNNVAQVTAGVGSGELNFGAAIVAGQPVQISSFVITEGNA